MNAILPPAANFHLNTACNFKCKFCFARFEDSKAVLGGCMLSKEQQLQIIAELPSHGVRKLTFAGGEPTLIPWLAELIAAAKSFGMTTMLVTNGSRLTPDLLATYSGHLDWLAFSVDSADDAINIQSGRAQAGAPIFASRILDIATEARAQRIRIKLNTVVHDLNADEDMSDFVKALRPDRWKIFQVLPIGGQNDRTVDDLLITKDRFDRYVDRHRHLEASGIPVVPENNDAMTGSYIMIDPAGRFFDNTQRKHTYSRPILDVGIKAAINDITFDNDKFVDRGGLYDWDRHLPPFIAISGVSGAGKDTAADFLVTELGYQRIAIADTIKEHVARIFGLSQDQLWGDQRNDVIPELDLSPRAIYQRFGAFCRDIDPDIWLRDFLTRANALVAQGQRIVCTDLRTFAEFDALQEAGATIWRVNRPGAGALGELAEETTEAQARALEGYDFDVVIENDGSLEELRRRVLGAAGHPA